MENDAVKKEYARDNRFWELDFLRGLCITLMVIDHFFYVSMDILPEVWAWCGTEFWKGLNEFAKNYWYNYAHSIAHYVVVTLFMVVCGISCTLSRSNLIRGLKAAGVAVGITLVTKLTDSLFSTGVIWFGVIHMYACAILLYWFLSLPAKFLSDRLLPKISSTNTRGVLDLSARLLPAALGITFLILFFALWGNFELMAGYNFNRYFALVSTVEYQGSSAKQKLLSLLLDIKQGGIESADYFPLLPYAAIVLSGSLIGNTFYKMPCKDFLKPLNGKWNSSVTFIGRHALFVYIIHQIIFIAFMFCVGSIYFLF